MGKEVTKETRQLIKDPLSIQKHARIKEDFDKQLISLQKKYKVYLDAQRPHTESLIDILCAELAFSYTLRKKTIYNIIKGYYRYEETDN